MIRIVMRPQKAPVVAKEGLYLAEADGQALCTVRARNAPHAERKLMCCLLRELPGKCIDFNLERFLDDQRKTEQSEKAPQDRAPAPERPSGAAEKVVS